MSRILVTGADGEIGRAVSESLVAAGHSVTALSLSFSSHHPADRLVEGDATSPDVVDRAMDDVDAVAHFAAIPHPTLGTPIDVFRVNTAATFTVLTRAGERGVRRAVIASSINAIGYPNNPHGAFPRPSRSTRTRRPTSPMRTRCPSSSTSAPRPTPTAATVSTSSRCASPW